MKKLLAVAVFVTIVITVSFIVVMYFAVHSSAKQQEKATEQKTEVFQLPDCSTPCAVNIKQITDVYSDGEPIMMLPPGWSREKAIPFSGKGHIVIEGGDIHCGWWQFWSADDPKKVVLVRVFGK